MTTIRADDPEQRILEQIKALSVRLRELRTSDARENAAKIKLLEGESRAKWGELRSVRAGPVNVDITSPRARGYYH